MDNLKLNRLALLVNLGCLSAGVLVYAIVAAPKDTVSTILYSLAAFAGSYYCTTLVSRRMRGTPMAEVEKIPFPSNSPVVRILIFVPVVLTMFEIVSLLGLGAEPRMLSWIHILAACAAGQNAEAIFRKP